MRTIKVSSPSPSRRKLIVLLCALVLIAAGVGVLIHVMTDDGVPSGEVNKINYDPPSKEDKQEAEDEKVKKIEDQSTAPAPQPVAKTVVISSATYDTSTKTVVVKTELKGSDWQTCELTASKAGSNDVVLKANVLYQSSFSSCLGFSLPADQLESPGQWTLTLVATDSTNNKSTSDPVSVLVNK
jgi:hypothetical protein